MSISDILRETMTLTKSVGELESLTGRLADKIENHNDRIIKLELREEYLQEKMANTAIKAVNEMNGKLFDRLTEIEYATGMKSLQNKDV